MRALSEKIGARVAETLGRPDSSRIVIQVFPKESAWYVERGVLRGFVARAWVPIASGNAVCIAEFGITNLRVKYGNVHREEFFGPKMVDRKVSVGMSVKVADNLSGRILLSTSMEEESSDTIEMSSVAEVESPHLPVTTGTLPSEGFFSTFAEPLIALGSIAVAVFLLFHVRS
jgi:hypothetical protein